MRGQPSISTRLFLQLFAIGLGALLLGGSGLYLEVRELLMENLDQTLRSDTEILNGRLDSEAGKIDFEETRTANSRFALPLSGHYYQILLDETPFATSPSLTGHRLELPPDRQIAQEEPTPQSKTYLIKGPAGRELRVLETSSQFAGHPLRIIVAHDLGESYEMLGSLRNFLLLFGGIGALLLAFLGWRISRQALRPLRDFSNEIDRIGATTLNRRLNAEDQYRELSSLTHAFNAMLKRLQTSLQAREELLSDVSHELKTPVTVIRSHCDIYLQKPRPTAEYVEALEVIRTTAEGMGHKIRRLLGTAQTAADLMQLTGFGPLALDTCLHKAQMTVTPLARTRRIRLSAELESDLQINGQSERLIEAFANLLENAIKYNHEGGAVRISLVRNQQLARVRIEDNGRGIDPRDLDHIFERHYRGDQTSDAEGSGLGLVLVKTIIDAHLGRIEVSSQPGAGSCFSVYLPLAPLPDSAATHQAVPDIN